MIADFFSKYVGPNSDQRAVVQVYSGKDNSVRLDLDEENDHAPPLFLTPERAQEIGRALIKAGKYAAKLKEGGAK